MRASETSYKGNSIYEIDPEVLGKAVQVGQKVIQHVTPILNCDGYNLLQNNGEVAGQTVFHLHVHVIPRYENDTVKIKWSQAENIDIDEVFNAIKASM